MCEGEGWIGTSRADVNPMEYSNPLYKRLGAKLIVIACLFLAHASFANEPQNLAIKHLSSDLLPQRHSTTRAITVFNYSHGPSAFIRDEKALRQHIESSIASTWIALNTIKKKIFYTAGNGHSASGIPGFYTSFDPVQSAEYGGKSSDWRMLTVQLAPYFKYLELGASRNNEDGLGMEAKLSNSTIQALLAAGCDEKSVALLFISPKNAVCAQIVAKTLKSLSVQGILYPFGSSFTSACPKQAFAALIITDPEAIRTARIKSLNSTDFKKSPISTDAKLLAAAMRLADRNSPNYELSLARTSLLPDDPDSKNAAKDWIDHNLFGCGDHPEQVDLTSMIPAIID